MSGKCTRAHPSPDPVESPKLVSIKRVEEDIDSGTFYVTLTFKTIGGKLGIRRITRSELANPTTLARELMGRGLDLEGGSVQVLTRQLRALASASHSKHRKVSFRTGWKAQRFMRDHRPADRASPRLVRHPGGIPPLYKMTEGSTAKKFAIDTLIPMTSSDYVTFCICLALAVPLLRFAALPESFAIHLHSATSSGKTTLLKLIRSIYGASSAPLPTWDVTPRRLDEYAASCRDMACLLDESTGANTKELEQLLERVVFGVTSGLGRRRSSVIESTHLPAEPTRTIVVSTGNRPLGSSRSRPSNQLSGHAVRLFNIEVPGQSTGGIIDGSALRPQEAFPSDVRRSIFKILDTAIDDHGGALGDLWLQYLEAHVDDLRAMVKDETEAFLKTIQPLDVIETRIARKFGLVASAGAIAARQLKIGWHTKLLLAACRRTCQRVLQAHRDQHPTDQSLLLRLASRVTDPSLFQQLTPGKLPEASHKSLGFVEAKRNGRTRAGLRLDRLDEVFGSVVPRAHVIKLLHGQKMLKLGSDDGSTRQVKMQDGRRARFLLVDLDRLKDRLAKPS